MPYKDREKAKVRKKEYQQEHKEKISEYNKQYHKNHLKEAKEYQIQWRKKNIEKVKEQRKRRYEKRKQYIRNYKLNRGCAICGYNKCARVLCFHHNGDKEFCISQSVVGSKSLEEITEEMDKCVVLCANCHLELHERENNG